MKVLISTEVQTCARKDDDDDDDDDDVTGPSNRPGKPGGCHGDPQMSDREREELKIHETLLQQSAKYRLCVCVCVCVCVCDDRIPRFVFATEADSMSDDSPPERKHILLPYKPGEHTWCYKDTTTEGSECIASECAAAGLNHWLDFCCPKCY